MSLRSVLALSLVLSAPAASQEGVRWYDDLEAARTAAAVENKHLLVDFTGTTWCAWCQRLDAEVLSRPQFHEPVSDRFVLVRLDFDARGRAVKDLPHAARNDRFKEATRVAAFPTVLLLTADGVPYAREGFMEGGPGPYADWVVAEYERARALQRAVPGVVAKVTRAKTPEEARAASDDAAKVLTDAGPHALARPLVPIVRTILAEEGLTVERERAAVTALVTAEAVDDDVVDRAFRLDPRNEEGLPEGALAAAMKGVKEPEAARRVVERADLLLRTTKVYDPQRAARLYGDCAFWSKRSLGDPGRARAMARFALSLRPEDPGLRAMLEDLSGG